jgi:hypothetical protein
MQLLRQEHMQFVREKPEKEENRPPLYLQRVLEQHIQAQQV